MKKLGELTDKVKHIIRETIFRTKFSNVGWKWILYDIKYGIKNLVSYFKVIWCDRDWDYRYWLILNEKKLARMEKLLREHGNHVGADRDADDIRKARLAIKRILNDDYNEMIYKNHNKKWGSPDMIFEPYKTDEEGNPTLYTLHFDRENAGTEELKEQERKEYRRLMKREDELRKQDLEYAMKIISKHLFGWWD